MQEHAVQWFCAGTSSRKFCQGLQERTPTVSLPNISVLLFSRCDVLPVCQLQCVTAHMRIGRPRKLTLDEDTKGRCSRHNSFTINLPSTVKDRGASYPRGSYFCSGVDLRGW